MNERVKKKKTNIQNAFVFKSLFHDMTIVFKKKSKKKTFLKFSLIFLLILSIETTKLPLETITFK